MNVVSTPYGMTTLESVEKGARILELATEVYALSPEGYLLGLAVGRMLARGFDPHDVRAVLELTLSEHLTKGQSSTEGADA